jgi:hypothetical protein
MTHGIEMPEQVPGEDRVDTGQHATASLKSISGV